MTPVFLGMGGVPELFELLIIKSIAKTLDIPSG